MTDDELLKMFKEKGRRLSCSDFGFQCCCDSCHDDANEGYGDLCGLYASDVEIGSVCCAVGLKIEETPTKTTTENMDGDE